MMKIFIEENFQHQQMIKLIQFIESNKCASLELRRCKVDDSDFDLLMKALTQHGDVVISLIFNIQMIDNEYRFRKFVKMLKNCPKLQHLQVHANNIDDAMFVLLQSTLQQYCPELSLLDIGDNRLTNRSIPSLCSLIIPDSKRSGLKDLTISANRSITNAGWTELIFAISFNSNIEKLALDYNQLDDQLAAMLSILLASSQKLKSIDLEGCELTEYAGQLFLGLFTKYPVALEDICLEKNPDLSESTRKLIQECLNLKSRRNSTSSDASRSFHVPITEALKSSRSSVASDDVAPVTSPKKIIKHEQLRKAKIPSAPDSVRSVGFKEKSRSDIMTTTEARTFPPEDDIEIEEMMPIENTPIGSFRYPHY